MKKLSRVAQQEGNQALVDRLKPLIEQVEEKAALFRDPDWVVRISRPNHHPLGERTIDHYRDPLLWDKIAGAIGEGKPPAEAKPPVAELSQPGSSLPRNGQKIKVGDQSLVYVGDGANTGEALVRTVKLAESKETFCTVKNFGKMKLQEVARDQAAGKRIFRDKEGQFFEVREHGSGYMVAERPEYRIVNKSDIK